MVHLDFEAFYDAYWQQQGDRFDQRRQGLLARHVHAGDRVLQVDCGPGVLAARLAEQGAQVVGTDLSAEAVRRAQARGVNASQVNLDRQPLPFADASFDLVFCQLALLWMPLEPTLAEVRRVLQPGGVLVAIEPDYGGMIEHPPELATRDLWIDALRRADADPLVGRKLPGLLAGLGFDVQVELMSQLTAPAGQRFDLLRGLPLTGYERKQVDALKRQAGKLDRPWQQVAHLPFMLVTARL